MTSAATATLDSTISGDGSDVWLNDDYGSWHLCPLSAAKMSRFVVKAGDQDKVQIVLMVTMTGTDAAIV